MNRFCLLLLAVLLGCSPDEVTLPPDGGGGTGDAGGGNTDAGSGDAGTGDAGPMAGDAGMPTCPGTATGCVIDFAGQFGTCMGACAPCPDMDGVGTAARIAGLGGITGDGTNLYIGACNTVKSIDIATGQVTTIAGVSGTGGHNDANGTNARFGFVDGVATDGTTLWVNDGGNAVIRAVDLGSGDVTTLSGRPMNMGFADGPAMVAQFDGIRGMTFDGTYLYVTDVGNQAVRRIDASSGDVVTVAGNNRNGQNPAPGAAAVPGLTAQFSGPRNLHAAGGNLYVGDTENHTIVEIVLGGANMTRVLTGATAAYADGDLPTARFDRLRGLTNEGMNLFVADSDNYRVRRVDLAAGQVTTTAGGNQGHREAIGTRARFDKPMDIHFDPGTGDLFIVEGTVIRRMYR